MKLGGTNVVPELQDISFLNDTSNPTIIMGKPLALCRTTTVRRQFSFHQLRISHTLLLGPEVARQLLALLGVSTAAGLDMSQELGRRLAHRDSYKT